VVQASLQEALTYLNWLMWIMQKRTMKMVYCC